MSTDAAAQLDDDDFEAFAILYELVHAIDPDRVDNDHLLPFDLDNDARGILDDIEHLLTTDPAAQVRTRTILREAISAAAETRMRLKS